MLLADIAAASARVAATPARTAKVGQLAELLRHLSPDEAALAVTWLSGELTQRQLGVGWASLRGGPAPAEQASLTIAEVESRFDLIKAATGAGAQRRRRELLERLFADSTAPEQVMLRGLLSGELRQGALGGVMTSAIAKAADVRVEEVRRAAMFNGGQSSVARVALTAGSAGLAGFGLRVGTPLSPMLAQTATDPADALARLGGRAAFEWKLDGTRIQVHRDGDQVAAFTRSLDDVTARLPEVVSTVLSLPVTTLVADGEVIALREDGRPHPFQVTAGRLVSRRDVASRQAQTPLTPMLFDVLHLDGRDLLDLPAADRAGALARITTPEQRVARIVTGDTSTAQAFISQTLARGHEGVMAKNLGSGYEAGRRGAGWLKIKPVHTLDLVVLAVERGSGRRVGTLSNIHLGARDPAGGFVMLGKTFKGMTDEMLAWQTRRFTELAEGPGDGWVVRLRPEQVVEIAFDGVQRSSRYPGGLALRFARVVRYRDDKRPEEADTIDAVRAFSVE